jgi:hypothetical protein
MKYEITETTIYRNIQFIIEGEDQFYNVTLVENDIYDDWKIFDEEGNEIEEGSELYDELIALCEESLNK